MFNMGAVFKPLFFMYDMCVIPKIPTDATIYASWDR